MSVSYILNMATTWSEVVQESGNTNNTSRDDGILNLQYTYSNGSGSGRVNNQYHEYRTLPSGGNRLYDLRSVTGSLLGSSIIKTFSKVKGIGFKNYSAASGFNIGIGVTGISGFSSMFGSPSAVKILGPNAQFSTNDVFGYPVNTGSCLVNITNLGTGNISYEFSVAGEA